MTDKLEEARDNFHASYARYVKASIEGRSEDAQKEIKAQEKEMRDFIDEQIIAQFERFYCETKQV